MNVQGVCTGCSPSNAVQVKLFKGASEQQEIIVGKILESIDSSSAPRAPEQSGQNLNLSA